MLKKKCLIPLKLGILFGLIAGFYNSFGLVNYQYYFHYHLYNTMTKLLIGEINRQIITITLVLYAVWLVYNIGGKLKEKYKTVDRIFSFFIAIIVAEKLKPTIRTAYHIIIISSVIVAVALKLGVITYFKQFNSLVFQTAYAQSKSQIFTAGGILLLGVGYLFKVRMAAYKSGQKKSQNITLGDIVKAFSRLYLIIEKQNIVFLCVAIFAFMLNISALLLWNETAKSTSKKPNIIIIMADTLRADHVGCYGYPVNTTPNIDNLAKDGIRFSQATANSSWTAASVASFMTSQYPQTALNHNPDTGKYRGTNSMSTRVVTLAQSLQNQGYSTGAVISNTVFKAFWNGSQGFDYLKDCSDLEKSTSKDVYINTRDWLATSKKKPFFLFALFIDPHSPYQRHSGYVFDPEYKGQNKNEIDVSHEDTLATVKCDLNHVKALYDSNIAYTDHYIGRIINDLKKRGLYDNSIIIFLSDHGEQFADHGGFFHGDTLYKELLHVPFIIKLPNQTKGKVFKSNFPLINMYPTILSLIGLNPSDIKPQGKAVNINHEEKKDSYIYAATTLYNKLRSVQNQKYKYIYDLENCKQQLYDLIHDPLEQNNIAVSEPVVAAALKKAILDKEKEVDVFKVSFKTSNEELPVSEDQKNLRSLGYLQ